MKFRTRLLVAITATTVVTVGGAFAAVSIAVNRAQEHQLDEALFAEAEEEAFESSQLGGDTLAISSRPGPYANDVGPLTKYGAIYGPDGPVLATTPTFRGACEVPPLLLLSRAAAATAAGAFNLWCGSEHLRGVLVPIPGHPAARLLLAAPRTDLDGDAAFLARAIIITLGISVAWALVVSMWLVRRLTRDHQAIALVARQVAAGDLSARIRSHTLDREMAQLAGDIDTMVDRLAALVTAHQRFVANAAHELQSPLTALYTELQQALRKPRDLEGYRSVVEEALASTRRLTWLSKDLLSLVMTGHEAEKHSSFAIADLVEGVCSLTRAASGALPVSISFQSDGDGASAELTVVGQRRSLERLVRNVLENAVRYSPPGGRIEVRIVRMEGNVELHVADEGPGVTPDERERIFEPFYRNPKVRASVPEGAGLGLAIAREIARVHGGDVLVSAHPRERGAEFVIVLPTSPS